jgi:Pectate lyase superfamily protein
MKRLWVAAFLVAIGSFGIVDMSSSQSYFSYPKYDVRDYGAVGNGITDDTSAIQSALNAAGSSKGGVVIAPAASYRINGTLSVPPDVTLQGEWVAPLDNPGAPDGAPVYRSTFLLAYSGAGNAGGTPFITLAGNNSSLKGVAIYYPNQSPYSITPYPFTIRGNGGGDLGGGGQAVINVLLLNSYQGVDFSYLSGRHHILGLYGQPLYRGILVDQCYSPGVIQDVHFFPFWSTNANVLNFIRDYGIALELRRSDAQMVNTLIVHGYGTGIRFIAPEPNAPQLSTYGDFTNVYLECDIGIDVWNVAEFGVHFSNFGVGIGLPGALNNRPIWGRSTNTGLVDIRGGDCHGIPSNCVRWEGGTLLLSSSSFFNWASGNRAVYIVGGQAMIQNNYFAPHAGTAVQIDSGAGNVMVTGDQLNGNVITNHGAHTFMTANQP